MVANSPELVRLANNALKYGIDIVRDSGGDITPFVMVESDNGINLSHFASDRLEVGVQQAKKYVWNLRTDPSVKRYAIVGSGYATTEGVRYEAVMVLAGERGYEGGYGVAQCFSRKGPTHFEKIGDPMTDLITKNFLSDKEPEPSDESVPPAFNISFPEFGFTINYPNMELERLESKDYRLSQESGRIFGNYRNSDIYRHVLMFSWLTPDKEEPFQVRLDEYFSHWSGSELTRDPIRNLVINDLNVGYQAFSAVFPNGRTTYGVCGVWSVSGRSFTIQVSGGTHPQAIFKLFKIYLSTFSLPSTRNE